MLLNVVIALNIYSSVFDPIVSLAQYGPSKFAVSFIMASSSLEQTSVRSSSSFDISLSASATPEFQVVTSWSSLILSLSLSLSSCTCMISFFFFFPFPLLTFALLGFDRFSARSVAAWCSWNGSWKWVSWTSLVAKSSNFVSSSCSYSSWYS